MEIERIEREQMQVIKIGWKEYVVERYQPRQILNSNGQECYGEIFYDNCTININSNNSQNQTNATLIHEVLHGIEDMYGIELGEENVTRLADALYTVIKDNPQIIRGLISPLDER